MGSWAGNASAAAVRSTLAARAVRSNSALGQPEGRPVAPAARGASAARVTGHVASNTYSAPVPPSTGAPTHTPAPVPLAADAAHSSLQYRPRGPERRPFPWIILTHRMWRSRAWARKVRSSSFASGTVKAVQVDFRLDTVLSRRSFAQDAALARTSRQIPIPRRSQAQGRLRPFEALLQHARWSARVKTCARGRPRSLRCRGVQREAA